MSFFESDGRIGSEFGAVYDMHVQIEEFSKALAFFDIDEVFEIILETTTVTRLEYRSEDLFACLEFLEETTTNLAVDYVNTAFIAKRVSGNSTW